MKFRSELDITKIPWPLHHRHQLLLIGSCFTENMGEKLRHVKFRVSENPHGILFNPVSVAEALTEYIENRQYNEQDLFRYNEAWHSWKHHSRFSGLRIPEALEKINTSINGAHVFLQKADYLFITLGSAWTYRLTHLAPNAVPGSVAANNHKAPASWFNRTLLTVADTVDMLEKVLHQLSHFNPFLKVIFTISPVRHLREGAINNNRSKAVLIGAVHQVIESYENCYYFPAYELVIDDLRDYRFYAEDLVHPNYAATGYVWEKFVEACFSPESQKLGEGIKQIKLAYNHKPFNPASAQHQKFLQTFLHKTSIIKQQHPYLDFSEELRYFDQSGSTNSKLDNGV